MKWHVIVATDPLAREKEIHREEASRLNKEIIRLKIKCGEDFTMDEMLRGFGDPPDIYGPQDVFGRHQMKQAPTPSRQGLWRERR